MHFRASQPAQMWVDVLLRQEARKRVKYSANTFSRLLFGPKPRSASNEGKRLVGSVYLYRAFFFIHLTCLPSTHFARTSATSNGIRLQSRDP